MKKNDKLSKSTIIGMLIGLLVGAIFNIMSYLAPHSSENMLFLFFPLFPILILLGTTLLGAIIGKFIKNFIFRVFIYILIAILIFTRIIEMASIGKI